MKKLIQIVSAIILCVVLISCSRGTGVVRRVEVDIGASERFTEEEIELAMAVVKEHFASTNDRWSELTHLWYDEAMSNGIIERRQWEESNTIILFSHFMQGQGMGQEQQWMPMDWVLVREDSSDTWRLLTWGKTI